MAENGKNALLLSAMREWYEKIFTGYIDGYTDNGKYRYEGNVPDKRIGAELSCPFCMGLTDAYENCGDKIRVMIVGQEACGFDRWSAKFKDRSDIWNESAEANDGWTPKGFQAWAVAFMDSQIDRSKKYEKKNSPFWGFFRAFKDLKDAELCWDNVDKVYYGNAGDRDKEGNKKKQNDRGTLTYKAETVLSKPFATDNGEPLSLLQREIKVADPDVIVFAIGPRYALSLDVALGISKKDFKDMSEDDLAKSSKDVSILFAHRPCVAECVVRNKDLEKAVSELLGRDVVVLWTYHPRYLRHSKSKLFDKAIETISKEISRLKR